MAWFRRLLNVLRPDGAARHVDRELTFHLAERTDDLVAAGMDVDEAQSEARRRLGNRTMQAERMHDTNTFARLVSILADVRHAVRGLASSPGFTAVAIVSLAVGVGANTAIFSLTNALILRPLPVSRPGQLVQLTLGAQDQVGDIQGDDSFTNPQWEQLRDQKGLFDGAFAYGTGGFNLANGGEQRPAVGAWVSGDMFNVLGAQPVAGRLLQHSDDYRGCPAVAAVSARFAGREYGGAATAVGKTLSLNGHPFVVTGVVDPVFFGMEVGHPADIYAPLCALTLLQGPKVLDARSRWFLNVFARPVDGMASAQLAARLTAVAPSVFANTVPANYSTGEQAEYLKATLHARPAGAGVSDLRMRYKLALFTLMAVVGVVLLIACANIANLMLARGAARSREFALRLALGASRWRIARQLLTESLILSFAGAALGVVFARWASRLLVGFLSTGGREVWLDLSLDWRVLAFTIAIAAGTAVLFALAPAWRATRVPPHAALSAGGRGVVDGIAHHRLGKSLVVAQVALSLALLAASGLMLGSFRKLVTLDPGFQRDGVLLVEVNLRNAKYPAEQLTSVKRDILARLRALPTVASASAAVLTPIGRMGWNEFLAVPGYSPAKQQDSIAYFNQVSDGYFATLGTTLIAGRDISADDITQTRAVAVINQAMASHFFAGSNALGRTFRIVSGDTLGTPREVVGVVRDAKYQRLDERTRATLYLPLGQGDIPATDVVFAIRTAGPPLSVIPAVRSLMSDVNPAMSLDFTTLSAQVSASLARPRLLATLSGFFGTLSLLLAVIGLYGTMSYNVTRRRNEIGIRMALGAARSQVLRMVVGEAGRLVVIGIAFGAALAFATTRLVSSLLFGLTPTDPTIFAMSAVALAAVAMAAALFPAWRAARLDPMGALREP
jgi:putative ABC transport system permease protein